MARLTDLARKLLTGPNFLFLAELMEDGWPHVTPLWCDLEGELILVNTAAGRVKERNMRRDPRVAVSIANVNDPYERVEIRGRVVQIIDGAEAERHIHRLSQKYTGRDRFSLAEGERRVTFLIEPVSVR